MAPLIPLLALMAASAGANYAGQKKVNNERGKALQAELVQRSKLQQDSEQKAAASAQELTSIAAKQKALAAARDPAAAPIGAPVPTAPGAATQGLLDIFGPTGSSTTIQEAARQGAAIDKRQAGIARSQMNLDDYGNLILAAGKNVSRNAQDVGQNITSAQSYAENVLKPKIMAANGAGRDWNTLGDALQLAASIYAPMALGGGDTAAKAATKAAMMKSYNAGITAPMFTYAGL